MASSNKKLRAHRECINHKPQGESITKRKRNRVDVGQIEGRRSKRNIKIDRISELPDDVLLHIMKFMDSKDAVRTSILSRRWKDLCKRLTDLRFCCHYRCLVRNFEKFASWVLSGRDDSCSLLSLVIKNGIELQKVDSMVVDSLIKYALSHNVHKLKMNLVPINGSSFELLPLIFCSKSLTSLKLCVSGSFYSVITLPKTLYLPALKTLHLEGLTFPASDNDRAGPFSKCHLLTTLILKHCPLHIDAPLLRISNSSLSNLTIRFSCRVKHCKVVLCTPNLSSCTFMYFASHQLSSTCNLSLLEEVNLVDFWQGTASILIRWLQVLTNVKILTLNSDILRRILPELSNPSPMRPKPPYFGRLELVKVRKDFPADISREQVCGVVEYLFCNSPMKGVHVIKSYY